MQFLKNEKSVAENNIHPQISDSDQREMSPGTMKAHRAVHVWQSSKRDKQQSYK